VTLPAARLGDPTVHGGVIVVGIPTVIIGGKPAARIGDMHTCPLATGPVPHVGGPICLGAFTVLVSGMPAARATDMAVCVGPPDAIAMGQPNVLIGMAGGAGLFGMLAGLALAGLAVLTKVFGSAMDSAHAEMLPDGSYVTVLPGIRIEGTPEYQAKVLGDLGQIANTPTGSALIDSIGDSGKQVTIRAPVDPTDGNSCGSYDNAAGRFLGADGKAGAGSNSVVEYNPDRTKIGDEPWETRPPGIGLAHELVHAEQAASGTMTPGTTNNDARPDPADPSAIQQANTREVEAVGIPPNDTRDYTENKIRSEWDPPQVEREWY